MRPLNISLVQSRLAWHDPAGNRRHFEDIIRHQADKADLVVLPEMFTTGFTMDPEACAETMEGETVGWLRALTDETGLSLCGSVVIQEQGAFYNRLLWVTPDNEVDWYDKRHLFRMVGEHEHYSPGTRRPIFRLGEWRICALVCYDLRFPVWSRGINAFDLILYVANWPAPRRSAWKVLLPARGVENLCYFAGVNRVGSDGAGIDYAGDTMVGDFLGNTLAHLEDEEQTITVTLDGEKLVRYRDKFPAWKDADDFRVAPLDDI